MKCYYEVLGVKKDATQKEIGKAFRVLSVKHHPDRHTNSEDVEKHKEIFKEISSAYDTLSDPEKRQQYDRFGHGPSLGQNPFEGFEDFFTSVFTPRRSTGRHIILNCVIELKDVLNGGTRTLEYSRKQICQRCEGHGGKQGACQTCNGAGVRMITGPAINVKISCDKCKGSGKSIVEKCSECNEGYVDGEIKTIDFEIPKGVETGMKFEYRLAGDPVANGNSGNLYIVVTVSPHSVFSRHGPHVSCVQTVDYANLVLGTELEVPTLTGTAKIKIPAGTQSHTEFRLRGLGLPVFNNRGRVYTVGDQLVEIRIDVPKKLTDDQKSLIEQLAKLKGE